VILHAAISMFLSLAAPAGALETVTGQAAYALPLGWTGEGARALGMGSAFVGVAEGSATLSWNVAGLASMKSADLSLHHHSGLAGANQETFFLALPSGSLGTFGLGLKYLDYGNFEARGENGEPAGVYGAGEMGFSAGWGTNVGGGLALGVAAKAGRLSVAESSYSSFSGDLGATWKLGKRAKIGAAYANLGNAAGSYAPAGGLRLGGSFDLANSREGLLLAAAMQLQPDGQSAFQLGAEAHAAAFALRGGYRFKATDSGYDGLQGMTLGAGLKFGSAGLDYAYLPFGNLGASQRVSLDYSFGAKRVAKTSSKTGKRKPTRKKSPGKAAHSIRPT
jgi:hypothetical protein